MNTRELESLLAELLRYIEQQRLEDKLANEIRFATLEKRVAEADPEGPTIDLPALRVVR